MKRKNAFSLFLALMMALTLPLAALAEDDSSSRRLEGLVTEIIEGGFLMEDKELGEVLLNVDATTVLDGILADEDIQVGQYVLVEYDGRLTRSIPPQAHADLVGCYRLTGTASELYESGVLLTGDPLFGDVIVHLNGTAQHVYPGMPLTVYFDGVMAMSYPGQVGALYTLVPELHGAVSERDEEGFTLTDESGESYRVLVGEGTLVGMVSSAVEEMADGLDLEGEDADGDEADSEALEGDEGDGDEAAGEPEGEAPEAAEPEANPSDESEADPDGEAPEDAEADGETSDEAADEVPEDAEADGEAADQPDDGEAAGEPTDEPLTEGPDVTLPASAPEWGDGDSVIVYYDGAMTKSLPPQLTALEVLVIR